MDTYTSEMWHSTGTSRSTLMYRSSVTLDLIKDRRTQAKAEQDFAMLTAHAEALIASGVTGQLSVFLRVWDASKGGWRTLDRATFMTTPEPDSARYDRETGLPSPLVAPKFAR